MLHLNLFAQKSVFINKKTYYHFNKEITMQKKLKGQQQDIMATMPHVWQQLYNYACFRLGTSVDAEDAVQETFMRYYSRMKALDKGTIYHPQNFLFRILINICNDWKKQQSLFDKILLDENDVAEPMKENKDEEYQRIISLLKQIPQEQAEVVRLRIYGNNSFAEIADILTVPLPTVKSRFLYGLKNLRKRINNF